ncbi:YeeE/YedE family protein [Caldimonas tepidiphila]|uniref:YeeE/YedE family protein n=1 Tax=Caldimonas tepidiphila TaxID=2315841 RepID=UPI000E5B9F81|nr:YeeE/YedE family protein [Caldimonas tepidiphila]
MQADPSLPALTSLVVLGGLLLGALLGALAQATRFCTMGALADWFTYRDPSRLLAWLLAVAVAALGAGALVTSGALDAARSIYLAPRLAWLSALAGGAVFGFGMVLASGCPQRALVRAGAGNLKALVTLLAVAVAAQMTLRGLLALPRTRVLDPWSVTLAGPQDLPSILSRWGAGAPEALRWTLLALLALATAGLMWRRRAALERSHWIGGLGVGLLVVAAWALTGHFGHLAEHPDTLEAAWLGTQSGRPEAFSFVGPLAHGLELLTLWTDRSVAASFGVTVALGVALGSAASALLRREFRWEAFRSTEDLSNHLIGGMLMGFGGVTALGCSIGQGVSGLSLLSAGALLAVAGIALGARAALRWQEWRIERLDAASQSPVPASCLPNARKQGSAS